MKSDMQTAQPLLTYDDYCRIPDDGRRYEVIHGVLYMSPSPLYRHQKTIGRLFTLLDQFVRQSDAGEVLIAPFDVVLSEHDVVQPDVLFISKARLSILTEKNAQGAPDLCIEVLSKGNRRHDEVIKRELYEQYGVQEYWIADPVLETLMVYRLNGNRYVSEAALGTEGNDELTTPLLPGFHITKADIFGWN